MISRYRPVVFGIHLMPQHFCDEDVVSLSGLVVSRLMNTSSKSCSVARKRWWG